MKKLKLDIDTLAVQSFSTAGVTAPKGTVQGHAFSDFCDSVEICRPTEQPSCDWWPNTGSCSGVIGTCVTCGGAGCGGGGQTSRCV